MMVCYSPGHCPAAQLLSEKIIKAATSHRAPPTRKCSSSFFEKGNTPRLLTDIWVLWKTALQFHQENSKLGIFYPMNEDSWNGLSEMSLEKKKLTAERRKILQRNTDHSVFPTDAKVIFLLCVTAVAEKGQKLIGNCNKMWGDHSEKETR